MVQGCNPCAKDFRYMDMLRACELTMHMLEYVKDLLTHVDSMSKSGRVFPFRSRYKHIERVTERALRICAAEGGDFGIIAPAAIFHDSGYYYSGEGHALRSAKIFKDYINRRVNAQSELSEISDARRQSTPPEKTSAFPQAAPPEKISAFPQFTPSKNAEDSPHSLLTSAVYRAVASESALIRICDTISAHSNKNLPDHLLSLESRILMDADLLDETGAMAILFDCFFETESPAYDYVSAYNRISERYSAWTDENVFFHTDEGKRLFLKARRYAGEYIVGLKDELGL